MPSRARRSYRCPTGRRGRSAGGFLMRFRGSWAVVALVVLAAAGCGGSQAHRPTADRSSAAPTPAAGATPTVVVDVSADADPTIPPGPPPQPSAPPPAL